MMRVVDTATNTYYYREGTVGQINGLNHPSTIVPDDADAEWFVFWLQLKGILTDQARP
jgi:hypothetical protein